MEYGTPPHPFERSLEILTALARLQIFTTIDAVTITGPRQLAQNLRGVAHILRALTKAEGSPGSFEMPPPPDRRRQPSLEPRTYKSFLEGEAPGGNVMYLEAGIWVSGAHLKAYSFIGRQAVRILAQIQFPTDEILNGYIANPDNRNFGPEEHPVAYLFQSVYDHTTLRPFDPHAGSATPREFFTASQYYLGLLAEN